MNTRTTKRIRRFLSIVGVLAILSTLVVVPTASAYTGADAPTYATTFVDDACDLGLIDCDRADPGFAKAVDRATGYQMLTAGFEVLSETARSPFTDVAGEWWESAANTAYTLGWTNGTSEGVFGGSGVFARQQMCVALDSLLGLDSDGADLSTYPDGEDISSWAVDEVGRCVEAGLMGGGTNLNAKGPVNKVDAIIMMVNAANYADENEVDVVEVAASSFGVSVDDVLDALDFGGYFVDGELVFADEEEGEEEGEVEEGEEEGEVEEGEEEEGEVEEGEEETPPVVSGAVTATLGSVAAPSSIIDDATSGDGAQALVPVTSFVFTAGSEAGVVNTIKFTRNGVSISSDVSNAYLYDGAVRIAEMTSSAEKLVTFTNSAGLFTVSAGTSKEITLKYDLANGVAAGKTIGFGIAAATDVELAGGGNAGGTYPLNGTLSTVAQVGDLGKLTINSFTTFPATLDPGVTDREVWRFNLVGADQDVEITKLNLTLVGTVAIEDIVNIQLKVNGVNVGAVLPTVNSDKEALFDLSSATDKITLLSGQTRTVTVHADIVGGTSRSFKFTIRKSSDVTAFDKNYSVWLKPNQTDALAVIEPTTAAGTSISSGKLVVTRATDSPSSNVALGATAQQLAKFKFEATGEAIKITTLVVEATVSGTPDAENLNNGKVYVSSDATVLGSQVGTTADFDSDNTDDGDFTDSAADALGAGTDDDISFSLGNTFIIPAAATRYVTLVADILDGGGGVLAAGSPTIKLAVGGIVATGQVSLSTITVGSADGNTLTATAGTLTATENIAVGDASATSPTGVPGASATRIGSWVITAGAGESSNVTQIVLIDAVTDTGSAGTSTLADAFQNLKLCKTGTACVGEGNQVGSTVSSLTDTAATTYTFSVSPAITLVAGAQLIVDAYADLLSTVAADPLADINADTNGIIHVSSVTATGTSTSSDNSDANGVAAGQNANIATSGTFSVTLDSATPRSTLFAGTGGVTEVEVARFLLRETTGAEGIKVTQIVITDVTTAGVTPTAAAFNSIRPYIDGAPLAPAQNLSAAAGGTATFQNLTHVIPASSSKVLVIKAIPSAFGGGTMANSDHNFQFAASGITASGAVSNTATNAPAVAVTTNNHTWARTSLALSGTLLGASTARSRTSDDKVMQLDFAAGSPYHATLRGALQANDEADGAAAGNDWLLTAGTNANAQAFNTTGAIDGTNGSAWTATTDFDVGDLLLFDFGTTAALQTYGRASFWIKIDDSANAATTGGDDINFIINDANDAAGTQETALAAMADNTWVYQDIALTGLGATDRYVGLEVISTGELAATFTIYLDNLRFYTDSLSIDLSGNLIASLASHGKAVQLKDASGTVKMIGYLSTTVQNSGTAELFVGDDIGNAASSQASDLTLSAGATTSYYVHLSSTDHVLADTTANEGLTVKVDLGNPTTAGDVVWYDNAVSALLPLSWVNGTTPLQVSTSY